MRDLINIILKENSIFGDTFTRAYLEAMFWSDYKLEYKSEKDIAPECLAKIKAECEKFENMAGKDIISAYGEAQAGHDFWFTRNNAGVGFWECDHCDEETGEFLTKLSEKFGNVDVYIGDDGLIYCD